MNIFPWPSDGCIIWIPFYSNGDRQIRLILGAIKWNYLGSKQREIVLLLRQGGAGVTTTVLAGA
jgi:hypothetical protein